VNDLTDRDSDADVSDWLPPANAPTPRQQLILLLTATHPGPDAELVEKRFGSADPGLTAAFLKPVQGITIRDFLEDPSRVPSDDIALLKELSQFPAWSAAFAAFVLHGYILDESRAHDALTIIKRSASKPAEGLKVLESYRRLRDELDPNVEDSPAAILHLVSAWPERLQPSAAYFAWAALKYIINENDKLRNTLKDNDKYVRLKEKDRTRAVKQDLLDSTTILLLAVSKLLLPEKASMPSGLAAGIVKMAAGKRVRLPRGARTLAERLKEGERLITAAAEKRQDKSRQI
jgi:hypothetical protein